MATRRKKGKVDWQSAPDVKGEIDRLIEVLDLNWLNKDKIICYRSENSRARAYARIWGLPRLWQMALEASPTYCLEVLSENFDRLSDDKKIEVLLHELAHIPKNFSGALVPHTRHRKGSFHDKLKSMISAYKKLK